jgi:hypothetical protein
MMGREPDVDYVRANIGDVDRKPCWETAELGQREGLKEGGQFLGRQHANAVMRPWSPFAIVKHDAR